MWNMKRCVKEEHNQLENNKIGEVVATVKGHMVVGGLVPSGYVE